jgi:hypothetical protein
MPCSAGGLTIPAAIICWSVLGCSVSGTMRTTGLPRSVPQR